MRVSDQTLNRLKVLKAIRRHGPISRSELPRITRLSGGTITQLTSDLVQRKLVRETKTAERRTGRPRTHLEIDAGAGIVIGASLGGVGVLAARFVDLLGQPLFDYDARVKPARTLDAFMANVGAAINEAIERSPYSLAELTRVGLALPGLVDSERGTLHFMTTFPTGRVPAAQMVTDRVGLPVTVENGLASIARGIHWFGPGEHLDTFTLIEVGYAVATAEYADGLPKSGSNGLNSEIGHTKAVFGENARPCFCGGKGCLSAYTSIFGLLEQAGLLEGTSFPALALMDPLFESLLDRGEAGDAPVNKLLDDAADHLAVAVSNYLTATDPGTVLISMPTTRFADRIEDRFRKVLKENTFPGVLDASEVRFILADGNWRQSGTAALALEQTYLGTDGVNSYKAARKDSAVPEPLTEDPVSALE
jgi:predicted NBD/HSP70 family sugar kinase